MRLSTSYDSERRLTKSIHWPYSIIVAVSKCCGSQRKPRYISGTNLAQAAIHTSRGAVYTLDCSGLRLMMPTDDAACPDS